MLLANPGAYRRSFVRLFPSFYRRRVDYILDECTLALRGWLAGILFNMFVIASLSFVGLLILRIKLPLAQAALAGILTFIPNIGPTLSVIPPIAIALLDTPWKSFAVLILYILIQQIESNLLTPYVMAQQVSLLPAVTLLAQVFFATFFGFLGLLLALPLTVVGQVWLKEVIIKDILDPWHHNHETQAELVIVSESLEVSKASGEEAEKLTKEDVRIEDKLSSDNCEADELEKKT
jgi:predicted PurR-regulated permease PerM